MLAQQQKMADRYFVSTCSTLMYWTFQHNLSDSQPISCDLNVTMVT